MGEYCAVRADESKHLSLFERKINIPDSDECSEFLAKTTGFQNLHNSVIVLQYRRSGQGQNDWFSSALCHTLRGAREHEILLSLWAWTQDPAVEVVGSSHRYRGFGRRARAKHSRPAVTASPFLTD